MTNAGSALGTIDSDQEFSGAGATSSSTNGSASVDSNEAFRERSLMEALLAQKMARAAKYMRSNSTASIDSTCSHLSTSSELQAFKSLISKSFSVFKSNF